MPVFSKDIAVVGAGITGLSIAWHLARRGMSVRVFDGAGIGSGATAIQPGGVRQQWSTRVACTMAREAYRFYSELGSRLETSVDPGFTPCGYLFLCLTPEAFAAQREHIALQNELGIPSRALEPDEVAEIAEGVDTTAIVGAAWCERDGYFDRPQAVVAAFADAARREGVTIVEHHVERLVPDRGGWRVRLRGGGEERAGTVIVAAGYDTPTLLASLDVEVPIERTPRYLFYSDPIRERLLEPLVVCPERHFAAKQLADGSVLASDLTAGSVPGTGKEDWHRTVREGIRDLVPILEYVSFPVLVEGFYDETPDRQPIIGAVPGHDGLWLAAGLNGRGLMMAPAVGRMVAAAVAGDALAGEIAALGLERFAAGALIPESQVV